MGAHWYSLWKQKEVESKKDPTVLQQPKAPRAMSASEEIVWLRENVLKKGPKDNPAYAEAAKRLSELYATNYPGVEEDDAQ